MKASVVGRVRNVALPKTKPLLPVFEAVANSFQSLDEVGVGRDGYVRVTIERAGTTDTNSPGDIEAFSIEDNGAGFNDRNFESFQTADTTYKSSIGGKGVGRFQWLKAFDHVQIESHYRPADTSSALLVRSFPFSRVDDEISALPQISSASMPRTVVTLIGFYEPWRNEVPREVDLIVQRFIEHFIPWLSKPNGPQFELVDQGTLLDLREHFTKHYESTASIHDFKVGPESFTLRGFRLLHPAANHHRLLYCANYRPVLEERLDKFLPNLSYRLECSNRSFTYLGLVQGSLLDSSANADRTDLLLPRDPRDAADMFFSGSKEGVNLAKIREQAVRFVQEDLKPIIEPLNAEKKQIIATYIDEEAPQYRMLRNDIESIVDSLPPRPNEQAIDTVLHERVFRKEKELKEQGRKIMAAAIGQADTADYGKRLREFMDRYNEFGKSALAQYVVHRKIILDLLDAALVRDNSTGRYPLEKAVHNLVFPMNVESDEIPFDQQNLWIIDERLTFHSFLSSDKPFDKLSVLESLSADRPDLLIFNTPLVFSEGEQPLASIVVIEFKRPMRENYSEEDPLSQVFRMIRRTRDGKLKNHLGRLVVSGTNAPAYCYVFCDLTKSLITKLQDLNAIQAPDNLGWFGYNQNLNAYYEVISYEKLVKDAKKRNRALFDKLGIRGATSS